MTPAKAAPQGEDVTLRIKRPMALRKRHMSPNTTVSITTRQASLLPAISRSQTTSTKSWSPSSFFSPRFGILIEKIRSPQLNSSARARPANNPMPKAVSLSIFFFRNTARNNPSRKERPNSMTVAFSENLSSSSKCGLRDGVKKNRLSQTIKPMPKKSNILMRMLLDSVFSMFKT